MKIIGGFFSEIVVFCFFFNVALNIFTTYTGVGHVWIFLDMLPLRILSEADFPSKIAKLFSI